MRDRFEGGAVPVGEQRVRGDDDERGGGIWVSVRVLHLQLSYEQ